MKIAAFDIDGTLLNSERKVSCKNYNTLIDLGNKGIIRVAATGRNLHSLQKVFSSDFPIDYAVFSSGAGIMNWKSKEIIHTKHLDFDTLNSVLNYLNNQDLDFVIKEAIPHSHYMHYRINNPMGNDLMNYVDHYKDYAKPLSKKLQLNFATQFIVLINSDNNLYITIKTYLNHVKTILTTSPIDNSTLWVEIFEAAVSKASGIEHLCSKLKVSKELVFCVGNDYNDLDMLNYFENSFVVANAPNELTEMFAVVASNDNDGFTEAVQIALQTKV